MPKIKDIPQLYKANYRISVSISFLQEQLKQYEEGQAQFGYKFELVPEFQRGHVWTQEQQTKYVEWLLRGGESGREIYFNHPGWQGSYIGDMVCVDGLQRLTACLLFMENKIPAFGYYVSEYTDRQWLNGNCLYFNIASLQPKQCVEWYLQMNFTGTPHTEEELKRVQRILESYGK